MICTCPDGVNIRNTYRPQGHDCQGSSCLLPLPDNWMLVNTKEPESRTDKLLSDTVHSIIAGNAWSTHRIVLADGSGWLTGFYADEEFRHV